MMVFPRNEGRSVCLVTGRVRGEEAARHSSFYNPQFLIYLSYTPMLKNYALELKKTHLKGVLGFLWIPGPVLDD